MMNLVTNEKQELLYLDGDIINMCSVLPLHITSVQLSMLKYSLFLIS